MKERPSLEAISRMRTPDEQIAALELRRELDIEENQAAVQEANLAAQKKVAFSSSPVAGSSTKFRHFQCGELPHKLLINETIQDQPCEACKRPLKDWAEIE